MKRRFFALLLITGTFHYPLQAQQLKDKPQEQRILYMRQLPSAVRSRMPRGTKSRFFGSFKLSKTKPIILLHLYNSASAKNGVAPQQNFTVDVFEIQKKRKSRYRLLQRFPLNYKGWGWAPEKFGAQLLWLDSKQHRQPIIKFDCISSGMYGPSGDNVLATFPQGITEKPVVQSFNFGAWRSSSTSGQSNTFDGVDENGLLQIST